MTTREKKRLKQAMRKAVDTRIQFSQRGYKKTQPMWAALSDFKNYTLKRK